MSFRLREGVGEWVDRAPWRIEWGGGSSVENPHYQRVHYCQLLVGAFFSLVIRTGPCRRDLKVSASARVVEWLKDGIPAEYSRCMHGDIFGTYVTNHYIDRPLVPATSGCFSFL